MEWLNLHTSVLDSAEFLQAEPIQRATWLCLQRYCIGQENTGRIVGAKSWKDRIWQQMCRVTLREVQAECGLWKWEGDDLVVSFYNVEKQKEVSRLRNQAAAAGHASWNKRGLPKGEPQGMPDGLPVGNESGKGLGNAERKGKERKGIEGNRKERKAPGALLVAEVVDEPLKHRLLQVNALMHRREGTPWSAKEWAAFQAMGLERLDAEAWAAQIEPLAAYYAAPVATWLREFWGAKEGDDFRRRDLLTLLHNWPGEVDRAVKFADWLEQKKRRDEEGALP